MIQIFKKKIILFIVIIFFFGCTNSLSYKYDFDHSQVKKSSGTILHSAPIEFEQKVIDKVLGSTVRISSYGVGAVNPFFLEKFNLAPTDIGIPYYKDFVATGIIFTTDGLVLTNKHVLNKDMQYYRVSLSDGREFKAQIYKILLDQDLAVLELLETNDRKVESLPVLELGNFKKLKFRDPVFTIRLNTRGEEEIFTKGRIRSFDNNITASDYYVKYIYELSGLIETDLNIDFGNSGGPLVNNKGQLVGVMTVFNEESNLSYAIPIPEINVITDK